MTGKTRALVLGIAGSVLAAGLFSAKACLYVKGIPEVNQPPSADITLQNPDQNQIYIGTEVHLSGENSSDPEGGELTYEWSLEYDLQNGGSGHEDCGIVEGSCNGGDRSTCCVIPLAAHVTYTARLTVYDDRGFRSREEEFNFETRNRPPVAQITAETPPNPLGHYVVGQHIWLHAFDTTDPDPDSVLNYAWSADPPPASDLDVFVFEPSDINRNATQDPEAAVRCLVVPDVEGSYQVHLTVDDGELSDSDTFHIEVDPDQPPCIARTLPDASMEELLFELDEKRRLEVVRVTDDLDPYPPAGNILFTWSVEEHPGEGLRTITGHHEPYLDMDPSEYVPGQQVRVRVTIQDREARDLSGCNVNLPECNLTPGCPQWVTWNIEYR